MFSLCITFFPTFHFLLLDILFLFFLSSLQSFFFYLWHHFFLHIFFHVHFFLPATLFILISCCIVFVKNVVVILFLFFWHLLDLSIFVTVLCFMVPHQCCILYSLFCRPYFCFCHADLNSGSNILFKAFPFISFNSFFFMYPHACISYISAGIKQASKSFDWTLISSFLVWFFDPIVSISLLAASHFCFNSKMIRF